MEHLWHGLQYGHGIAWGMLRALITMGAGGLLIGTVIAVGLEFGAWASALLSVFLFLSVVLSR